MIELARGSSPLPTIHKRIKVSGGWVGGVWGRKRERELEFEQRRISLLDAITPYMGVDIPPNVTDHGLIAFQVYILGYINSSFRFNLIMLRPFTPSFKH